VAKGATRYGVMPALTLEALGLTQVLVKGRCDLAPTETAVAPTTRECVRAGARGMAHLGVE